MSYLIWVVIGIISCVIAYLSFRMTNLLTTKRLVREYNKDSHSFIRTKRDIKQELAETLNMRKDAFYFFIISLVVSIIPIINIVSCIFSVGAAAISVVFLIIEVISCIIDREDNKVLDVDEVIKKYSEVSDGIK